jgi:8-oxo-dGTP pyrophosphatase MutT (NUDIX family)
MRNQSYFAQKAFIIRDEKLLLIKKSGSDPNQANKWEVPGGRMKFGEDLEEHIKREVLEEVGLEIAPGEPFFLWQWMLKRKDKDGEDIQMQIVAVARICIALSTQISFDQHQDDDYIAEYAWVPFSQIKEYDTINNMRPVLDKFISTFSR